MSEHESPPTRNRHARDEHVEESGRAADGPGEDFHAEEVLDKPFDRGLALRLAGYVSPYRGLVALSLGLMVMSTVLPSPIPLAGR